MSEPDNAFQLLSLQASAKKLGVSPQTLRRHLRTWNLTPVVLGRRVLLRDDDLRALILRQCGFRSEAR